MQYFKGKTLAFCIHLCKMVVINESQECVFIFY